MDFVFASVTCQLPQQMYLLCHLTHRNAAHIYKYLLLNLTYIGQIYWAYRGQIQFCLSGKKLCVFPSQSQVGHLDPAYNIYACVLYCHKGKLCMCMYVCVEGEGRSDEGSFQSMIKLIFWAIKLLRNLILKKSFVYIQCKICSSRLSTEIAERIFK